MNTFDVSRWLWDFYSWATVLLAVALVINYFLSQPARRIVIAWSTAWALLALALLTAVPNWSQYSLVASQSPRQVEETDPFSAPNAPPNFEQRPQPQQQIAFPPPNMAAVETAPPNVVTIDWSTMAMTGLLVGSTVVMCWLALGAWQVRRLCASASPAPDEINRILSELSQGKLPASQLGISKNLPVAVAVGLVRPWILLPQMLTNANREQARSVLAHELAHVANRDLWLLAMLRGLMILLWPHPLFWLLRRQVRLDQELLADAAAAELTSRGTYAEQLVALARSAVETHVPRLASSVGLWERPSQLTQRIALLLDDKLTILRNCSRSWRIGSAGMLAVLALALSLVTLAPRAAESRAETATTITEDTAIVPREEFAKLLRQSETKEGFANAVGDLVAAAIQPSQLPFVSEKRLAAIRHDFVIFVNKHTPGDITAERKAELLAGLRDHAQQHMQLWNKPVTEDHDLNNFYLNFNDRVKTLKWELWMALTRESLDNEEIARLETQRNWMRQTIKDQPKHRHYTHAKVLDDLEATFDDPLCVIFDRPMSDEAFAKFKSEIESWLAKEPEPNSPQKLERDEKSGLWKPVVRSELPHMVHHFLWEALIAQYRGEKAGFNGPSFDNDEIGGFGAGDGVIRLGFASNHANEGSNLSLSDYEKSGNSINADTGYMADSSEVGDFAFSERDNKMISLNGAKLLPLPVFNWIEADETSVEDLKTRLTNSGVDEVDLGAFLQLKRDQFEELKHDRLKEPPFILAQNLEERMSAQKTYAQNLEEAKSALEEMQDGEGPYVAVLTNEGNIAVAHLTDLRDRSFGSFYVRTRVRPKPLTNETVGEINAQAGAVAQVGKQPNLNSAPGAAISGRVVTQEAGNGTTSAAGSVVSLQRYLSPEQTERGETQYMTTRANRQGEYRFDSLPSGIYSLNATQAGWVTHGVEKVEVIVGKSVTAPDIVMTRGGTVRVQLVDELTGKPAKLQKPTKGFILSQPRPNQPGRVLDGGSQGLEFSYKGIGERQLPPGQYIIVANIMGNDRQSYWQLKDVAAIREQLRVNKIYDVVEGEVLTIEMQKDGEEQRVSNEPLPLRAAGPIVDTPAVEPIVPLPANVPALKTETRDEANKHTTIPPKLLYLAWQSEDLRQTNPDKAILWDRSGKELGRDEAREFLSRAGNIGFTQTPYPLTPLVLFFEVDPTINASVSTTVITSDGTRLPLSASSRITPTNGINTASLGPMNAELEVWPSPVSLRLTYAIENWRIIKTVREFESLPIDVAEGVRWYLDPTRANDRDPQTGRSYHAVGKTAGILELSEAVQNGLVDYAVRVYLKGQEKPVNELGVTTLSRKDGNATIRISEAFDSADQIERVEFIRQRRAVEIVEDVPLRTELLPKNGNRREVPITPEGKRRIDRDAYENGVLGNSEVYR
jgi:beta-lactamase regulating signal transducer with metallopeptidase domain